MNNKPVKLTALALACFHSVSVYSLIYKAQIDIAAEAPATNLELSEQQMTDLRCSKTTKLSLKSESNLNQGDQFKPMKLIISDETNNPPREIDLNLEDDIDLDELPLFTSPKGAYKHRFTTCLGTGIYLTHMNTIDDIPNMIKIDITQSLELAIQDLLAAINKPKKRQELEKKQEFKLVEEKLNSLLALTIGLRSYTKTITGMMAPCYSPDTKQYGYVALTRNGPVEIIRQLQAGYDSQTSNIYIITPYQNGTRYLYRIDLKTLFGYIEENMQS
jgi:hypothetical protein